MSAQTADHVSNLLEPEVAERKADVLRALGNPVRLRMTALLATGEQTVTELVELLALPQPSVSRQLGWLRLHGVVTARSEGGFRFYSLAMPQLHNLLACLEQCHRDGANEQD